MLIIKFITNIKQICLPKHQLAHKNRRVKNIPGRGCAYDVSVAMSSC